ncbi:MAG: hypothetical protein M3Q81_05690 [bacterium]|nr:hypothetical protein [bacterium]
MSKISFNARVQLEVNIPSALDFNQDFTPQVKSQIVAAGQSLLTATEVAVSDQAVAAMLMLPAIEMISGLPAITLYGFGSDRAVEQRGTLALSDWRHNTVRPQRANRPEGETFPGFTVIDGGGRTTPEQIAQLAVLLDTPPDNIRVVAVPVGQIDTDASTKGIVEDLLAAPLTRGDWEANRLLYMPPGFGLAATLQGTAIYGLSETWPRTIRVAKGDDSQFNVAEVVIPQDMRQWATQLRVQLQSSRESELLTTVAGELGFTVEGNLLRVTTPSGSYVMSISSISRI